MKGNRRIKLAGVLLLIVGGLTILFRIWLAVVCGLLYVIAGAMVLIKKSKDQPDDLEIEKNSDEMNSVKF
ncbi:hypothetical protein [Amphibacillus jilinensis]|uniref:hypothetical protein n=1 Tax=Amphibacillus jilinensis TaxID=1216008 RepID=UPI0003732974|nr:hypothetical protein [Amphibacillus jilinensis]